MKKITFQASNNLIGTSAEHRQMVANVNASQSFHRQKEWLVYIYYIYTTYLPMIDGGIKNKNFKNFKVKENSFTKEKNHGMQ